MNNKEIKIKESYDIVAEEYESHEHKTCRNFDYVTRRYIIENINFLNLPEMKVLEIGAGNCWISRLIADSFVKCEIYATDISSKMIEQGEKMSSIYTEIHFMKENISSKCITDTNVMCNIGKFDLIICGLSDPYISKDFLIDILPMINDYGRILITVPTRTWARNLRLNIDKVSNVNETWHTDKNGKKINVPSICMNISDMKKIIPEDYQVIDIRELKLDNKVEPSKWIKKVSDLLHIEVEDLPIVTVAIIEKK